MPSKLVVHGDSSLNAEPYSIKVSGAAVSQESGQQDSGSPQGVISGQIGSWTDTYSITGDIVSMNVPGPARVTVDGEQVSSQSQGGFSVPNGGNTGGDGVDTRVLMASGVLLALAAWVLLR
ncbi:hypothetical protein [Haloarcula onubensis]|uniref:PGF-CTERM sorting domain-containing protein n=1 Tax=Haloarcula onubensis TaxID=2950539 RepID=A0ABU2FIS3_9EURY|nr:hypothetical protein [Halomicroarcula sp. S3CR25-11]MDS0280638.1 hypothetical protein [Halomicroarcula sp. S3CR25-11]